MGRSDRITILLSVGALCATIIGTTCSTNARIGDLDARIDDVNANVNARIDDFRDDFNARIDDLRADVATRIGDLRADVAAQFADVNARIDGLRHDVREPRAGAIEIDADRAEAPDKE